MPTQPTQPTVSDGGGLATVVPYGAFTAYTPALPQFYWDVYSAEQRVKHLCYELGKLAAYADMLGENINLDHTTIKNLLATWDEFQDGKFMELYAENLDKYLNDNFEGLFNSHVATIWFGLTEDGCFCAYYPETWDDVEFDTGGVYGRSDYGHLILRTNCEGTGVIDNTYSYSLNMPMPSEKFVADLEVNTKRTNAAYKTLFTNLDTDVEQPAPQDGRL